MFYKYHEPALGSRDFAQDSLRYSLRESCQSAATSQSWRRPLPAGELPHKNIATFLQLVVAGLRVHHFSFERFSNKVHMETTMELSTGKGPSEVV